jgi:hypothetical protein
MVTAGFYLRWGMAVRVSTCTCVCLVDRQRQPCWYAHKAPHARVRSNLPQTKTVRARISLSDLIRSE